MTAQSKKPPPAAVLAQILRTGYHLGRTPEGKPFAARIASAPGVMITMDDLEKRLAVDYYAAGGNPAPRDAIKQTTELARSIAEQRKPTRPWLRIAERDGTIYLDLGRSDGQSVAIWPGGWQVVPVAPVLFERTAMTGELPVPVRGGSLDAARKLINISSPSGFALYIACRVASLLPGIAHPVEMFTGGPGTCKTATTRITGSWIDPSPAMVPMPKDGRGWATVAGSSYVLPMDNLSSIPAWFSDLLCKAVSGDGWVDRALYTDGAIYVASFQSVILINGITLGSIRGDLADRAVIHKLERPAGGQFMFEDVVERSWSELHPSALGWLLDQVAAVRNVMWQNPRMLAGDRMARFSEVVSAVDRMWGTQALARWQGGRQSILLDSAEGDSLVIAIRASITQPWEGTASELLSRLEMSGALALPERWEGQWTPRSLSERLTRAEPSLNAIGYTVGRGSRGRDTEKRRVITILPPSNGNGPGSHENGSGSGVAQHGAHLLWEGKTEE